MGHNGGPDWRAMMAGEDTKALERLSRFKEPGVGRKTYRELGGKLAEGAEPLKLAENASLNREHLYRMLSENGNPELRSLEALLDALGFRLSITLKEAS